MELLGERPVWSMSGAERLATLDALQAELARLETYRLQVISGLDDIGYAQEIGAHDTVQLLAFRYRIDRPEARRDVRLAVALSKYAEVNGALPAPDVPVRLCPPGEPTPDDPTHDLALRDIAESGPDLRDTTDDRTEATDVHMRPAQADAIVSALERVPSTVPAADIAVAEQQLVSLARHLSPGELRKAGQRIRDILDTDGPEPDERKAYDRECLTLFTAPNGVKFRGYLANENAELLRSLVHAGGRPHKTIDGHLDPRPRDKRQADALTATLTIAAASYDATTTLHRKPSASHPHTPGTDGNPGDPTPGADGTGSDGAAASGGRLGDRVAGEVPGFGAKATITVTIDLQDLQSATADATGELVYGDNLSAAAIRRLACDAKIIPLVLGSNSEPLDVGRSERLVNRAMRRALNARDKGCVACGAPPIQCDAHHIRSWIDGGPTAVSNLVLLCRRHHIDLHAGDWTITITDGVVHVSRPTWADPPPIRTATPTSLQEAATRAIWGTPAPTTRRPTDHARSAKDPSRTLQPAGALHTAPPSTPGKKPRPPQAPHRKHPDPSGRPRTHHSPNAAPGRKYGTPRPRADPVRTTINRSLSIHGAVHPRRCPRASITCPTAKRRNRPAATPHLPCRAALLRHRRTPAQPPHPGTHPLRPTPPPRSWPYPDLTAKLPHASATSQHHHPSPPTPSPVSAQPRSSPRGRRVPAPPQPGCAVAVCGLHRGAPHPIPAAPIAFLSDDEYVVTGGALSGQRGYVSRDGANTITGLDLAGRLFTRAR